MPRLWTPGRLLRICGLLALGVCQALAAIAAAIAAARLLGQSGPPPVLLAAAASTGAIAVIALRVLQRRLAEQFALAYVKELRLALISHVLRMPANGKTLRFGSVMTRVVNDFSAIRLWLASGLVSTLVAGCVFLTVAAYLAIANVDALLALSPALLLWLLVPVLVWKPLDRSIADSRRRRGRIAATAGIMLRGRMSYLAFGRHGSLIRKLGRQSDRLNHVLTGRATLSGLLRSSSDIVLPVTAVLIGLAGTASNAETLGILIMVTGVVVTQLNAIALAVEYRLAHRVAVARLKAIFDRPTLALDGGSGHLKRTDQGRRLSVDDLTIPSGRRLSFRVDKGERVTLTGLVDQDVHDLFLAIAGLAGPMGGTIRLDGRAAEEISRRDWLRSICLLSPALPTIPGSLSESVAMGNPTTVTGTERARLCKRFGLRTEDLNGKLREDSHLTPDQAAALRAVRCLLRGASLVLVDDPDLLRNTPLRMCFLEEIERRGTTLVIASAGLPTAVSGRRIELGRKGGRAA